MPCLTDLKALLEGQIKHPTTLTLEVVFDNKGSDAFDAINQTEELLADLKLSAPGAVVRGKLVYAGKDYEVK
jgi:hypothetical protein